MPVLNINSDALRRKILIPSNPLQIILEQMQLVTCQDIVTLNATVIGDGLTHNITWEQISGTPVTFLESVEQTMTTFRQPAIRDDKIFRFYVDKGLTTEKYRDILITSVSKDPIPTMSSNVAIVSYVGMVDRIYPYGQPAMGSNGSNVVTLNNNIRSITWTQPTKSAANIIGIRLIQIINGVDHVVGDIPKEQNVVNDIIAGQLYRLDYVVKDTNNVIKTIVGPFVGSSVPINTVEMDTWESMTIGSNATVQVVNKLYKKELILQQFEDPMTLIDSGSCTLNKVVVYRTLVQYDPIIDSYTSELKSSTLYVKKVVTDRSVISIG
jgi:hypothetical protein